MTYTPKYKDGEIGIRFKSNEDINVLSDKTGGYLIDYEFLISNDVRFLKYFEEKYNIKLLKSENNNYQYEYFNVFKCEIGKEDDLLKLLSNNISVDNCSRIDERMIFTNELIIDINERLDILSTLEMDSLDDLEINKIIDDTINKLNYLREYGK